MTPAFQVTANSVDITEKIKARLISLQISDEVGINSDTAVIEIDDRDGAVQLPAFGADLQIGIGYTETGIVSKGRFRVDEIEASGPDRRMLIRARSADTNAVSSMPQIKAGKDKTWLTPDGLHAMTIRDIATKIASDNGLAFACNDDVIGSAFPASDQQTSLSDIDYLGREVRNVGGQLKIANGSLILFRQATAAGKTAGTGQPMPTIEVIPSDCMRWRCLLTRRSSHKKVTAISVDANGQENPITIASRDATEEDSTTVIPERFAIVEDRDAAAQAKVDTLDVGSESVSLSMVGNPAIGAEVRLNLKGFKAGVDRIWIAARVQHHIDEQGFTTEVEAVKQLE
jgi:phage protein D